MAAVMLRLLLACALVVCLGTRDASARRQVGARAADPSSVHARHARRLVHESSWATLSTISVAHGGAPYGHIVSYSDGIGQDPKNSTGVLYFYLTPMDAATTDLKANPSAAISLSMAQNEKCTMDVQDPTCWKLTLVGDVVPVDGTETDFALQALLSRHPQMKWWPPNHGFHPFQFKLKEAILLDFYGGAKHITPQEYFAVTLGAALS